MIMRNSLHVQPVVFCALLFLANGCASTPQTQHTAPEPVEVHKIFVLGGIGTEDNKAFTASFVEGIAREIRSCKIDVKVENVPVKDRSLSLDTDPFVTVNLDIAHYAPDAVLRVMQKPSSDLSSALIGIAFNAQLLMPSRMSKPGGPMPWRGTFKTGSRLDAAEGAHLAQVIANQLKQDDIIQGCGPSTGGAK